MVTSERIIDDESKKSSEETEITETPATSKGISSLLRNPLLSDEAANTDDQQPAQEEEDGGGSRRNDGNSTAPTSSCLPICTSCSRHDWIWIAGMATAIELFTCLLRFGFHMQSTRDTPFVAKLTWGIRIHHGYIGVIMLIVAANLRQQGHPAQQQQQHPSLSVDNGDFIKIWFRRVGCALIISDLMHHFCVLWPITGDPHFDLVYPS